MGEVEPRASPRCTMSHYRVPCTCRRSDTCLLSQHSLHLSLLAPLSSGLQPSPGRPEWSECVVQGCALLLLPLLRAHVPPPLTEWAKHTYASGPLHVLFLLSGMFNHRSLWQLTFLTSFISLVQTYLLREDFPPTLSKIAPGSCYHVLNFILLNCKYHHRTLF